MSMPALLSQFGLDTHRYVTTDGRVIFDGVSSTATGFAHPEFGSVSAMTSHTFHGDGPEPEDEPSAAPWWHDASEMERHTSAVAAAFPRFVLLEDDGERPPAWYGKIDTGRGVFTVVVALRRDRGLPFVKVIRGGTLRLPTGRSSISSPHLYLNGNLCIADQSDWNPDEATVATAIAWTAHWLAAFTEWRMTRRWPIEGFHNDAA